jgi:hypothetical protein
VSTDTEVKLDLRNTFISMLFALAASQCAISGYDNFVSILLSNSCITDFTLFVPILTHLILCVVVLTTSWIGWSATFSRKDRPKPEGVFCRDHFILMIDVIILGLYFSLVKSLDRVSDLDASSEVYLMSIVFVFYAIWDLFFSENSVGIMNRFCNSWLTILFSIVLVSGAAFMYQSSFKVGEWYLVALIDLLLILTVLLFRYLSERDLTCNKFRKPEVIDR